MRSSIQVSDRLRKRLGKRKLHPRQSYEEVIARALDASEGLGVPQLPVATTPEIQSALAELKTGLLALYGERLVRLVLYGSVARGDARPDSDVDVLVVLSGPFDRTREIERIVEITYDILLDKGIHVSAHPMSEPDFLTRASPLLQNVRREGVPL